MIDSVREIIYEAFEQVTHAEEVKLTDLKINFNLDYNNYLSLEASAVITDDSTTYNVELLTKVSKKENA